MESSSQNSLESSLAQKLNELASMYETVTKITCNARNENLWEEAYGLIFSPSISRKVFDLCYELGSRLDYYDPDSSYEEDVMAFEMALSNKVDIFVKLLRI